MKALIYQNYGQPDVLHLQEIEKPLPGENEILVRVNATTVNRTDSATVRGIPFFARLVTGIPGPKKKTPGTEFAGVVESVGKKVTGFKSVDRVFGFTDLDFGTHAEYVVVKEKHAVHIPEGISFELAAASSEGAHYAWNFIKPVKLHQQDQKKRFGQWSVRRNWINYGAVFKIFCC